jgi:acyl-CoA dehydrogenase
MSYPLSPDCLEWQSKIRAFTETELIPWEVEAEMNDGVIPEDARRRHQEMAGEMGLNRMDLPQSVGGLDLSTLTQTVIWEQLGRVTNALCWCFHEPEKWLFEICTDDQLERYVLPSMRGERHDCYAITEEDSGSDVEGIKTTARLEGNSYVINGEKWYVTSANHADYFILQAKLEGGENEGAHCLFFIDMDSEGVELVRTPPFSHRYASHHPTYRFNDVRVPITNRIGDEGGGMDYTYAWFRRERLMIAARCCGAASRLIDAATEFARERIINGKPITEYQAIQFMLADSLTELWAARLMTYETADAHDRGEDVKVLHARCSMTKLYASEMANRVADRAVQIFGGRGYMRENVAERFYRELRVDRIWEGTSEVQRIIIAHSLLKRGQAPLVD